MSRVEWCVAAITFLLVATGVEGSGDDESVEHSDEMLNVIKIVLLFFCFFYLLTICFRV